MLCQQEQIGIDFSAFKQRRIGLLLRIPGSFPDGRADLIADLLHCLAVHFLEQSRILELQQFGHGNPAHEFGVRVMLVRHAWFPHSLIWNCPMLTNILSNAMKNTRTRFVDCLVVLVKLCGR